MTLSTEEQLLLTRDGLEQRVRNKISSIVSLFEIVASYHEQSNDIQSSEVQAMALRSYEIALHSFELLLAFAKEKNRSDLLKKLEELRHPLTECKGFVEQISFRIRKHQSFLFSGKITEYKSRITEAVELVRV